MSKQRFKHFVRAKPKVTWTSEEGLDAFVEHIRRKIKTYKKVHPEPGNEQREALIIMEALVQESEQYKKL